MDEDKLEIVDSPDLPPLWQAFGASRRASKDLYILEMMVPAAESGGAALKLRSASRATMRG